MWDLWCIFIGNKAQRLLHQHVRKKGVGMDHSGYLAGDKTVFKNFIKPLIKHHIPTLQSVRRVSIGIRRVQGQVEEERSIEDAEKSCPERVPELIIKTKHRSKMGPPQNKDISKSYSYYLNILDKCGACQKILCTKKDFLRNFSKKFSLGKITVIHQHLLKTSHGR